MSALRRFALLTLLWPCLSLAQPLPPVTGVTFDGGQIVWDALPGAIGYNIHGDNAIYLDTVRGDTAYKPTQSGRYYVVAFDDAGNFSPIEIIEDDIVPTSNSVSVLLPIDGLEPPESVAGTVYSATAGEIFWNRASNQVLEYDVLLNQEYLGTTAGTSFFIDTLQSSTENIVSVVATDSTGSASRPVSLLFDTAQQGFPFPAKDTMVNPGGQPSPPQNANLEIYSDSAAELFWDRPGAQEFIVSTEISRDGMIIGQTPGTSFFDDGRSLGTLHGYRLVAIDRDGIRSEPTFVNPGPFDGPTDVTVERLMSGISQVTRNNPHLRWFPVFRGLTRSPLPDSLTEISSETVIEDGRTINRTQFDCGSGVLVIDSALSRFGAHGLTFDNCNVEGATFDGSLFITSTDLGGYNTSYTDLFIGVDDGEFVTMDGMVDLNRFRSNFGMVLHYRRLNYYSFQLNDGPEGGSDIVVELNQRLSDIVSAFNDGPRNTLTTEFTVSAPWTRERPLTITTTQNFSGAEVGSGNPITGELIAADGNGQSVAIDAATGVDSSFLATVITGESTTSITGNWNEENRLACLSFTLDDEAIPGCLGLIEAVAIP
ncbi:MAG: hypothetical protein AB8B63_09325 [Granulosicoccus sp.]